jgi:hypothetical protein
VNLGTPRVGHLAAASLILFFSRWSLIAAGNPPIPDVSATAQKLVANVRGICLPFKAGTSNGMPDGPVAGNGDIGLVLAGTPAQIQLNIGKADFWGVVRGSIVRAGRLDLNVPALKGANSEVDQNIGPATLTGTFTKDAAGLSFMSWVSTTKDMVVMELKNSGSQPLGVSSQLWDGLGTAGNEATYGSLKGSTWLKVSPDTMDLSVGNRLSMGPRGGFHGKIAGLRIFDQALAPSALTGLDADGAPKPLFHWPASAASGEHGYYSEFQGGDGTGATVGALLIPQRQFTAMAWVNATAADDLNFILSTMTSAYGRDKYPYQRGFALNLDKGRLSATLNYTTTTATAPVPAEPMGPGHGNLQWQCTGIVSGRRKGCRDHRFPFCQRGDGLGQKKHPYGGQGPAFCRVRAGGGVDAKGHRPNDGRGSARAHVYNGSRRTGHHRAVGFDRS